MLIGNSDNNENTNSNSVKDVTSENFMEEVVELSKSTPVIVDFWAPWCGPCKELGPNIEKAVNNANGKVVLAKVNIDENQAIAAQLRVQSIPTVYAFVDGQPVDGFMGAQGEDQVTDFVNKLLPSEQEKIIETLLEDGSEESLEEILTAVPGIGRWTAEIYLMFCLDRADIFPSGDLALQEATKILYSSSVRPKEKEMREIAQKWKPFRSLAALVLWEFYAINKKREGI